MRRLTGLAVGFRFLPRVVLILFALALAGSAFADGLEDVSEGNSAFKRGQYERAVESFTRAVISGDLDIDAMAITLNNRGVTYGELGDYDRAMQDYEDALALRPEDPTTLKNMRVALVNRGFAYLNLGDFENALDDYNRAIGIAPDHYLAYMRRGELALQEKRYEDALLDLERAETLEPGERVISDLMLDARRQMQEATVLARSAPNSVAPASGDAEATADALDDTPTGQEEPQQASLPEATDQTEIAREATPPPSPTGTTEASVAPRPEAETTAADPAASQVDATDPAGVAEEPLPEERPAEVANSGQSAAQSLSEEASAATAPAEDLADAGADGPSDATGQDERLANLQERSENSANPDGGQTRSAVTRVRTINPVNFRAGPGNEFDRVGTIGSGAIMPSFGVELGWYEIEAPTGERGYVYGSWLEVVE